MMFFLCKSQTLIVKEGNLASTHVEHLIDFDRTHTKNQLILFVWIIVETETKLGS